MAPRRVRFAAMVATLIGVGLLSQIPSSAQPVTSPHLEFGQPGGDCTLLDKRVFVVCYDEDRRIPAWVAYRLKASDLTGAVDRTDDFRADEALDDEARSEPRDYEHSGYDQGHMAPAEDFTRSERAMSTTFLLSNMTPQRPALNRGKWKALEGQIRKLAGEVQAVWIITGSLFTTPRPAHHRQTIGRGRVAVPTDFFKVILARDSDGEFTTYGFIMPNSMNPLKGKAADFEQTVNEAERLSGLNFFDALDDAMEERLESALEEWPF